jgi:hypothetical protein
LYSIAERFYLAGNYDAKNGGIDRIDRIEKFVDISAPSGLFFFVHSMRAFLVGLGKLLGILILCAFMLHGDKMLKCSRICSLYGVIIGISYSLVYHSLSIQGLTNSLYCNNIYA